MCGFGKQVSVEASSVNSNDSSNLVKRSSNNNNNKLINLDHGDPKMLEGYWKKKDQEAAITIKASELGSYFSDPGNLCWFMEPELGDAIRRAHHMVGNAVVEGRHIMVGTGSSQLFQASLFALSSIEAVDYPLTVVSAVPHYSVYPDLTDFLKSGMYKWGGDAKVYTTTKEGEAFIEVVCSPNNPCGSICKSVVKNHRGKKLLIHDLAYYWPHYTPITSPADHDLMLFTHSKCTGHAGSRIGWAIVKDEAVARKMVKFIELTTIGTSKEAQLRAAKLLNSVCNDYLDFSSPDAEGFFDHGYRIMAERWEKLRQVMKNKKGFSLAEYPEKYCQFMGKFTRPNPAFAWIECKEVEDGAALMREHKVLVRSGERFGVEKKNVRISMLDTDENFNIFLQRLAAI